MKQIITLFLAAVLLCSLAGCKDTKAAETTVATTAAAETVPETTAAAEATTEAAAETVGEVGIEIAEEVEE